jgi:hypothetical protein
MLGIVMLLLVAAVLVSLLVSFGPLKETALGRLWLSPQVRLLVSGLGIIAAVGLLLSGLRGAWGDLLLGLIALVVFGRDALVALQGR